MYLHLLYWIITFYLMTLSVAVGSEYGFGAGVRRAGEAAWDEGGAPAGCLLLVLSAVFDDPSASSLQRAPSAPAAARAGQSGTVWDDDDGGTAATVTTTAAVTPTTSAASTAVPLRVSVLALATLILLLFATLGMLLGARALADPFGEEAADLRVSKFVRTTAAGSAAIFDWSAVLFGEKNVITGNRPAASISSSSSSSGSRSSSSSSKPTFQRR